MALVIAGLESAIIAQLTAQFGAPVDAASQQKFALAIATAVINYLVTNTVVTVNTGTGIGVIS